MPTISEEETVVENEIGVDNHHPGHIEGIVFCFLKNQNFVVRK